MFENKKERTEHTKYYLPAVEIKDYNVMIDGRDFFDKPVKINLITYDNIRQIAQSESMNDNTILFFIIEEAKVATLVFSQGTVKVLRMSSYDLATACSKILFLL